MSTGRAAEIWDVEGRGYIDFGSGIAVLNTGHLHPKVQAAVAQQLDAFSHTCLMVTPYGVAVELAEKLNRLAPGPTPKKAIFVTTGAEAVEICIKIARAHTGRAGVIAFGGGFHGRTFMAMALTGKVAPYKAGFGPFPAEVYHAPFPLLCAAAILGDTVNYWIGHYMGDRAYNVKWIKREYLDRTHAFFEKHGGMTIFLARVLPIVRTFAPFVAGMGKMSYGYFFSYNVFGGLVWVFLFTLMGYFFGNLPFVQKNFELVIVAILLISVVPIVWEFFKARRESKKKQTSTAKANIDNTKEIETP